jgi:predicted TIM-barrel fold metal-dependent hydrolase
MNFRLILLVAGSVMLAGCLNEPIAQRDPALGEAVKYNAAVQTINPDPVYPEGSAKPGDSGEHGAKAVERYRKGQVKPVETMQTTSGTAGTGSSTGPR